MDLFFGQVSMVKIEKLVSVAKPTKYSRAYWLTTRRMIRSREDAQCGKKYVASPHFEVIAMEQFVGTVGGDIVSP